MELESESEFTFKLNLKHLNICIHLTKFYDSARTSSNIFLFFSKQMFLIIINTSYRVPYLKTFYSAGNHLEYNNLLLKT